MSATGRGLVHDDVMSTSVPRVKKKKRCQGKGKGKDSTARNKRRRTKKQKLCSFIPVHGDEECCLVVDAVLESPDTVISTGNPNRHSPRAARPGTVAGGGAPKSAACSPPSTPMQDLCFINNAAFPSLFLDCATRRAFDGSNVIHAVVSELMGGIERNGGIPHHTAPVWEVCPVPSEPEYVYIKNKRLGNRYLDSYGRDVWLLGTGVDVKTAGSCIKWRLEPVSGGAPQTFALVHAETKKFMDTNGKQP